LIYYNWVRVSAVAELIVESFLRVKIRSSISQGTYQELMRLKNICLEEDLFLRNVFTYSLMKMKFL